MNAISTVVQQLFGLYVSVRDRWPTFTSWVVVTPMIVVVSLFAIEFPVPAGVGAFIVAAELRYARVI